MIYVDGAKFFFFQEFSKLSGFFANRSFISFSVCGKAITSETESIDVDYGEKIEISALANFDDKTSAKISIKIILL